MNPISHKIDLYIEKYDRTMSKGEVYKEAALQKWKKPLTPDQKAEALAKYAKETNLKKPKINYGRHLRALLLSILAGGAVGAGASAIHDHITKKPKKKK